MNNYRVLYIIVLCTQWTIIVYFIYLYCVLNEQLSCILETIYSINSNVYYLRCILEVWNASKTNPRRYSRLNCSSSFEQEFAANVSTEQEREYTDVNCSCSAADSVRGGSSKSSRSGQKFQGKEITGRPKCTDWFFLTLKLYGFVFKLYGLYGFLSWKIHRFFKFSLISANFS